MFRLTRRSVRAHWRRFTMTTLAVVLGVAFVVGSFVLTDSLAASINQLLADSTGHIDFVVRATANEGGDPLESGPLGGGRTSISIALVDQIDAVRGVVAADPTVFGEARLLDKAGNASNFDFAALTNWPIHPDMSAERLIHGRAPRGDGEAVIDTTTAGDRGLGLGSRVRVATHQGVVSARVVGLAQRGAGNLGIAGQILAFTTPRAATLAGTPGRVGTISVRTSGDHETVRRRLEQVIGTRGVVLSADALLADARARIEEQLTTFNGLMLGFASVTLFVSAFLIWNTFSIVVAQRRRELALLRAVGASRHQVSRSIAGEGLFVGLTSSGVGIALGVVIAILLRKLLATLGAALPSGALVLAPRTVVLALLIGVGVTLLAVIGPARRTNRIPPVAAMQTAALPPPRGSTVAAGIGAGLVVVGAVVTTTGVVSSAFSTGRRETFIGVGALVAVVGVTMLSARLAPSIVHVIGAPIRRLGTTATSLASQNAVRDPRRSASTAAALMIGLSLVAATLVIGESVKTAFGGALRASLRTDIVVSAGEIVPFDARTVSAVRRAPGVRESTPLNFTRANLAHSTDEHARMGITTGSITAIRRHIDPAFLTGTWPTSANQVAIAQAFADEQHLKKGSEVPITADNGDRTFTVVGVYQRDELLDDAVADTSAVQRLDGVPTATEVILVSAPTTTRTLTALKRAAAPIPNSTAQTADSYVASQVGVLDIVLGIVDVLLLVAVLIAAIGIANTLALSVVERTRELGLLRAVGMARRQMKRMVRVEGVLVALLGGVLGLALGIGFGTAATIALPSNTAQLTYPPLRLAVLFVVAGILGVAASTFPARRAGRLNVLDAIAEP